MRKICPYCGADLGDVYHYHGYVIGRCPHCYNEYWDLFCDEPAPLKPQEPKLKNNLFANVFFTLLWLIVVLCAICLRNLTWVFISILTTVLVITVLLCLQRGAHDRYHDLLRAHYEMILQSAYRLENNPGYVESLKRRHLPYQVDGDYIESIKSICSYTPKPEYAAFPYQVKMVQVKVDKASTSALKSIDYDNLSGQEFEDFCAKLLMENGYLNVTQTPATRDFGADVIATKNGQKYAIQCKNYSGNVGNAAVQQVFAAKVHYNADIAVVITNREFTEGAKKQAKSTGVLLWDRNDLNSMIESGVPLNTQKQLLYQAVETELLSKEARFREAQTRKVPQEILDEYGENGTKKL